MHDYNEPRRRSHRDDEDNYAAKKPRSRWDETKRHEGEKPRSSRWDDSSGRSSHQNSKSRWDEKESSSSNVEKSGSRWDNNGRSDAGKSGSSQSRSRDRRSRSRSNSPFRRDDRNYSNYSNPSKDEKSGADSKTIPSSLVNHQIAKKYSSWSDSSSDEERGSRKLDKNKHDTGNSYSEFGHSGLPNSLRSNISATDVMLSRGAHSQGLESHEVKSNTGTAPGISLKLGGTSAKPAMPLPKVISVSVPVKAAKVASIFNDDDDEPEEMPPECKMRMKNVGRETKTSEGPNSFGKTKIGFCNLSHLAEKKLDGKMEAKKKP
ncbi:PEST proteolytic signal-containing nuclear protein [Orchesella cincta]|uniref:PEST proteolytic signal-containing nuclear protein n=1 Tax=Orchesella cincta TaxID=48709 RepID=A0A1D2N882_ORCCI|nr:PEST proteolytic signal-containing nuclear protein [Orchesella cincta]